MPAQSPSNYANGQPPPAPLLNTRHVLVVYLFHRRTSQTISWLVQHTQPSQPISSLIQLQPGVTQQTETTEN